jgi:hypothetical protein
MWSRDRGGVFSVDHIIPQSQDDTLVCVYTNLVYACVRCNSFRQAVPVQDPTQEPLGQHLEVAEDGRVIGITNAGRFLIELLHLNAPAAVTERQRIFRILQRYAQDRTDAAAQQDFEQTFCYPQDLPDLRTLNPPGGNALQHNTQNCFCAQRERNELPTVY